MAELLLGRKMVRIIFVVYAYQVLMAKKPSNKICKHSHRRIFQDKNYLKYKKPMEGTRIFKYKLE
jgi:hypothetical protein